MNTIVHSEQVARGTASAELPGAPRSRDEYKKLFIIGCPRSGTTWLQLLLAQHPRVATAPETQIFAYYLEHFLRQWQHEHEGPGRKHQGQAGLSRLLSQEEFEALCRTSARTVLDKIAARNPGAEVIVEKSPKHALQAEFIHQIFSDAYFLHLVRDPRDTAASLLAAGRSWGAGWAPKSVIHAARMWHAHVERARAVSAHTERFLEVRYEALRNEPAGELHRILEWLGIPLPLEECDTAAAACEFGALQKETDGSRLPLPGERSPEGFFRKGKVGGWTDDLSASDIRVIDHLCAEPMRDTGYEPVSRGWERRPGRIIAHDVLFRLRESVDWQLQRLLYRI